MRLNTVSLLLLIAAVAFGLPDDDYTANPQPADNTANPQPTVNTAQPASDDPDPVAFVKSFCQPSPGGVTCDLIYGQIATNNESMAAAKRQRQYCKAGYMDCLNNPTGDNCNNCLSRCMVGSWACNGRGRVDVPRGPLDSGSPASGLVKTNCLPAQGGIGCDATLGMINANTQGQRQAEAQGNYCIVAYKQCTDTSINTGTWENCNNSLSMCMAGTWGCNALGPPGEGSTPASSGGEEGPGAFVKSFCRPSPGGISCGEIHKQIDSTPIAVGQAKLQKHFCKAGYMACLRTPTGDNCNNCLSRCMVGSGACNANGEVNIPRGPPKAHCPAARLVKNHCLPAQGGIGCEATIRMINATPQGEKQANAQGDYCIKAYKKCIDPAYNKGDWDNCNNSLSRCMAGSWGCNANYGK